MSNPVYWHCPKCNGIRHKKVGKPKEKLYQCLRCKTITHFGIEVKSKKQEVDMENEELKKQRFVDWGCGNCYYNRIKGCSAYKLGSDGYESEKELKHATCQSWEPM